MKNMPKRIVTLALNPAVDVAAEAEAVRPAHKIRTFNERFDPGGGGVNVARVVQTLGGEAHAVLFLGGATGTLLQEMLDAASLSWESLPIQGRTRISLTVHDRGSGQEYRFVPEGPVVAEPEWRAMLDRLETLEADWLVASGSLPRGVPEDFYASVSEIAERRRIPFVVDTSGPALRAVTAKNVSLLKLSLREMEWLLRRTLANDAAQEKAAAELMRTGKVDRLALSLGAAGALLATREAAYRVPGQRVPVRSAVGAGDSFLAAMVLAYARGAPDAEALAWAAAAGTAVVAHFGTAQVSREETESWFAKILPQVRAFPLVG
jgi:6-phosphofructokinase 2